MKMKWIKMSKRHLQLPQTKSHSTSLTMRQSRLKLKTNWLGALMIGQSGASTLESLTSLSLVMKALASELLWNITPTNRY